MVSAGTELTNPVTGERVVFLRTAADTDGTLLEFDDYWTRPGHRAGEHVHPEMEERWEVVSGLARFRIDGGEIEAGPGDVVVAPSGAPHVGWNPGLDEVHLRVQMRPALRWENAIERLFGLAAEGRTDDLGIPEPTLLVAFLREFHREIAPA